MECEKTRKLPSADETLREKRVTDALEWLVEQMRGSDLWMDGTMHWSLPHRALSNIRARTALEAILVAYERSKYAGKHYPQES